MTELQGAVGLAQLGKLASVVARRRGKCGMARRAIARHIGFDAAASAAWCADSYWRFCLLIDPQVIEGGPAGLAAALAERGVASVPNTSGAQRGARRCCAIGRARHHARSVRAGRPHARSLLRVVVGPSPRCSGSWCCPWNEHYEPEHLTFLLDSIRSAVAERSERAVRADG